MNGFVPQYRATADLPPVIPIFPLNGILLLPRALLPLNVFEPRYLAMVDHVLSGHRVIGMIQPGGGAAGVDASHDAAELILSRTGCAGRVTAYAETGDGRIALTLTGLCRFVVKRELIVTTPFRQIEADYAPFVGDLEAGFGEGAVDRGALLAALRAYIDANGLSADWSKIEAASIEHLVNSLAMLSPYGPADKQALLEAPELSERSALLVALTERRLSGPASAHPPRLQ